MGETRKLTAILVADVVGYSRFVVADEDRTLAPRRVLARRCYYRISRFRFPLPRQFLRFGYLLGDYVFL
jgi:hypothetical protein